MSGLSHHYQAKIAVFYEKIRVFRGGKLLAGGKNYVRTSDMARYPLNLGMIFISEKKRRRVFARGIFIGYIVNFAHIRAGVVIDGDIFVFLRRTQLFHERERYPVRTDDENGFPLRLCGDYLLCLRRADGMNAALREPAEHIGIMDKLADGIYIGFSLAFGKGKDEVNRSFHAEAEARVFCHSGFHAPASLSLSSEQILPKIYFDTISISAEPPCSKPSSSYGIILPI